MSDKARLAEQEFGKDNMRLVGFLNNLTWSDLSSWKTAKDPNETFEQTMKRLDEECFDKDFRED